MKKLMIVMLVLGLATMANAAMSLNITSDDNAGNITFDLVGGPYNFFGGNDWAVIVDGTIAAMGVGTPSVVANLINNIVGDVESNTAVVNLAGTVGHWGNTLFTDSGGMSGGTTMYTGFTITATGAGTIELYHDLVANSTLGSLQDSYAFVPEPMTIALLGLGGLFIRRKK